MDAKGITKLGRDMLQLPVHPRLSRLAIAAADEPNDFGFTYTLDAPIEEKVRLVATRVYGADGVELAHALVDHRGEVGEAVRHGRVDRVADRARIGGEADVGAAQPDRPVALSGLFLSDSAATGSQRKALPPHSYIGPGSYTVFILDGTSGGNHLDFSLDAEQEALALDFGTNRLDTILFGPGSIDQAHAAIEYVECSQVEEALRFHTEVAKRFV